MNKFTYDYKCYKLGEFIYGSLNLNSNKENEDVKKEAHDCDDCNGAVEQEISQCCHDISRPPFLWLKIEIKPTAAAAAATTR